MCHCSHDNVGGSQLCASCTAQTFVCITKHAGRWDTKVLDSVGVRSLVLTLVTLKTHPDVHAGAVDVASNMCAGEAACALLYPALNML